jgi:toxin-antitoxin system PIN domain toxin
MFLLDVNVLIALVDGQHEHHVTARAFFRKECVSKGWATCAVTENAVLRILGHPAYPNTPDLSSSGIRNLLQALCAQPGHTYYERSPSLLDNNRFPSLPESKHLTDVFLLATAVMHQSRFVTFDQRIHPGHIPGGREAYLLLRSKGKL